MKKFVLLILFVFSCTLSSYAQFDNGLQFRDSLAGWTARHAKISEIEPILKKYNIDLEAIAQGPEEWDIKPYPELPEADAGDDDDDPWGDW